MNDIPLACLACDAYVCPRHRINFVECDWFCIQCVEYQIEELVNIVKKSKKKEYWCQQLGDFSNEVKKIDVIKNKIFSMLPD
tara:strand:+ start:11412 stop:11657 length:246 start_codon:yes stop_codon:yes gene_type:complete